jgi:hypothetical protein
MNETINERQDLAQSAKAGTLLDEVRLPISEEVKGACEIVAPIRFMLQTKESLSPLTPRKMSILS